MIKPCVRPYHRDQIHVRGRAFLNAAEEHGCERHVLEIQYRPRTHRDRRRIEATIIAWLRSVPKPIGVFTSGDPLARLVASVCRAARVVVPEEVAILGVGNDEMECDLATPPLSSIDHGTHRIGYEAAHLLAKLMAGASPPTHPITVEPVGVVVRQSTNTLAIDHPDVAATVRFIREHACDTLHVNDVLAHVPVSRRTLEINFKRILGRTIHQEILRVRVERAKQLLCQTDWDMVKISVHCGFSYPSQMSTIFKRLTHLSPQAYRQRFRAY